MPIAKSGQVDISNFLFIEKMNRLLRLRRISTGWFYSRA
uniref:Uncharacterized protein n=1 Tax=Rhizophora mucronata TaxID=61149 RepID=A0A2P2L3Q8_RHIMU